ncbi:uncharacterized protein LOC110092388 [Dendrobium catenatum]|uniref:uncharacterized protein LOC110092388 n=1 Tax=Dendrobium catenatum TaxID=906689 RepID=UPI0009F273A4|nr:uncharacterized protein LOC110092388 [Dendrobium catenatum]
MLTSWVSQRAKVNWLKNGEEDLKFLFAKIRSRRYKLQTVVNLSLSNSSLEGIQGIIHHFQDLYNPTLISPESCGFFPTGSWPDGFNFHFYKTGWLIIGPLLTKAVSSFFTSGYMPTGVKSTALALIPKHKHAAGRIAPIMPIIISKNQAGFIKTRVSTDNILLAKEILASCFRNGKKLFCAKIDIRKAFDTVSREFLIARMMQKGFPLRLVNWIKTCIYDVNFSVIIKGALEGYFPSSVGLRQGCPLSPLLFCIVMDALSSSLDAGGFKGYTHGDFNITHLLYADDVIIFGEANVRNAFMLSDILKAFSHSTGLHINLDKCSIMFTKNVSSQKEICDALSISNICSKITYLGIPLSFCTLKVSDFLPLMDSICYKMSGWKANLLSFAGRLQFLKFTILNSIAYWIRGSIIPKTLIKFLNKYSSKFLLFGEPVGSKKMHMISWGNICKSLSCGGLGIPSFNAIMFSFNCAVISRMYNTCSNLSIWLRRKYISPWRPPSSQDSKFWKSICKTAVIAKHFFKFRIHDLAPISIYWDHWVNGSTLSDINHGETLLNAVNWDANISSIISGSSWDLPRNLHTSILDIVSALSISINSDICLLWDYVDSGSFRAYMDGYYQQETTRAWAHLIWHNKCALRYSVFSWLAVMGGLKTADALIKRNICVPSTCGLCHCFPESTSHLFFECSYSYAVITRLLPLSNGLLIRPSLLHLLEWIGEYYSSNGQLKEFYLLISNACTYFIWKERNNRRFGNVSNSSITTALLINKAIHVKIKKMEELLQTAGISLIMGNSDLAICVNISCWGHAYCLRVFLALDNDVPISLDLLLIRNFQVSDAVDRSLLSWHCNSPAQASNNCKCDGGGGPGDHLSCSDSDNGVEDEEGMPLLGASKPAFLCSLPADQHSNQRSREDGFRLSAALLYFFQLYLRLLGKSVEDGNLCAVAVMILEFCRSTEIVRAWEQEWRLTETVSSNSFTMNAWGVTLLFIFLFALLVLSARLQVVFHLGIGA